MPQRTVLHVSPHPDDEVIGAPAALFALADAGWRVVNLACGLGRPHQHERRRQEVVDACRRAGFSLELIDPPVELSRGDDLGLAEQRVHDAVAALAAELNAELVVTPSLWDHHHGHKLVARATRGALLDTDESVRWWQWGVYAELPHPNLIVRFEAPVLARITEALRAHQGELDRADYLTLVRARAEVNAVIGPERVFGFGGRRIEAQYAELLVDVARVGGRWWRTAPRLLDAGDPLPAPVADRPL